MTNEQLPELFQYYWMMQEKLPKQQTPSNKDSLSKEWSDFLKSIKKRVEQDLRK